MTEDTLRNTYGSKLKIFKTTIPRGVKAAEGSTKGESIFTYDKSSKPAIAYKNFTKEVLDNERKEIRSRNSECR